MYVWVTRQAHKGRSFFRIHVYKTSPQCVCPSDSKVSLGTVVEDKHEGAAHAAQDVCHETLVQASRQALLSCNLLEAISRTLVEVLLRGLLRLHLQSASPH